MSPDNAPDVVGEKLFPPIQVMHPWRTLKAWGNMLLELTTDPVEDDLYDDPAQFPSVSNQE
jgi:hypothetical protein